MEWGYLSEFWNAITGVGEYTVEFFQSIGNAVGGAMGNLFEFVNHSLSDVFVFGGWFFSTLANLFSKLWLPVGYLFNFFSAFVSKAFSSPIVENIWGFSDEIMSVFNRIPYWENMSFVLGICILIIVGVSILKQFLRT